MGLRCLIGHDYGELLTSSDQQDRGDEVVVTVREYRECARCGHRRIITENKEIKAGASAEPEPEASTEPAGSSDDRDASTGGWDAVDRRSGTSVVGGDAVEPLTAEEDDGVILEDGPDRPTRGRGEWPDDGLGADDGLEADADEPAAGDPGAGDAAPAAAPDDGHQPEDGDASTAEEAAADEEPSGDGEIIDAEAADAGRTAPTGPGADGPPAGRSSPDDAPRRRPDAREAEFVCPECGDTWPALNASLRPGDICPECRQGYLSEQVVQ